MSLGSHSAIFNAAKVTKEIQKFYPNALILLNVSTVTSPACLNLLVFVNNQEIEEFGNGSINSDIDSIATLNIEDIIKKSLNSKISNLISIKSYSKRCFENVRTLNQFHNKQSNSLFFINTLKKYKLYIDNRFLSCLGPLSLKIELGYPQGGLITSYFNEELQSELDEENKRIEQICQNINSRLK